MTNIGARLKDKDGNIILPCPYYPIGSIYLSVNAINPGTIFGGVWERMSGGYLYGVEGAPNNSAYKGTGTQPHTLSETQIPGHRHSGYTTTGGEHRHRLAIRGGSGSGNNDNMQVTTHWDTNYKLVDWIVYNGDGGHSHSIMTDYTGGGQSHSHNVAFIGVYIWKRIS